ncbi:MAG TPA: response regulator, partial [Candidatus Acidoferrum sp.]|nr:response regulator [Candidatus Acidoferrum sp.]
MTERILVVDDEAASREVLEAILTQAGFDVAQVADGSAALASVAEAPPDLILLDIRMPGMSGLEVCRRLKYDPATGAIPIIVVTALGEMTVKEDALRSGADDFLAKPVRADDLQARVSAMLKVRRFRAEMDRTLAYLHELEAIRYAQRRTSLTQLFAWAGPERADLPALPVLLVDDEALTRDFYGDLLGEHGFQIFAVGSGAEALKVAQQVPLEAVILDIVMPGMSGLEVLDRLHQLDPDLPVIMLTGYPTSQNALAALKLGAFDFIAKGFDHNLIVFT